MTDMSGALRRRDVDVFYFFYYFYRSQDNRNVYTAPRDVCLKNVQITWPDCHCEDSNCWVLTLSIFEHGAVKPPYPASNGLLTTPAPRSSNTLLYPTESYYIWVAIVNGSAAVQNTTTQVRSVPRKEMTLKYPVRMRKGDQLLVSSTVENGTYVYWPSGGLMTIYAEVETLNI